MTTVAVPLVTVEPSLAGYGWHAICAQHDPIAGGFRYRAAALDTAAEHLADQHGLPDEKYNAVQALLTEARDWAYDVEKASNEYGVEIPVSRRDWDEFGRDMAALAVDRAANLLKAVQA